MDDKLLELARDVAYAPVPQWVREADNGTCRQLLEARDDLRAYLAELDKKAWIRAMPRDLRDLPAWHLGAPKELGIGRDVVRRAGAQVEADGRVFVTDGHALLLVDAGGAEVPLRAEEDRLPTRGVLSRPLPHTGVVTPYAIRVWLDTAVAFEEGAKHLVQLGEAHMDAELLAAWLWPCARLTDGPITVEYGGAEDATRWSGPGWLVMAMPTRERADHDPVPVDAPVLEVDHG